MIVIYYVIDFSCHGKENVNFIILSLSQERDGVGVGGIY